MIYTTETKLERHENIGGLGMAKRNGHGKLRNNQKLYGFKHQLLTPCFLLATALSLSLCLESFLFLVLPTSPLIWVALPQPSYNGNSHHQRSQGAKYHSYQHWDKEQNLGLVSAEQPPTESQWLKRAICVQKTAPWSVTCSSFLLKLTCSWDWQENGEHTGWEDVVLKCTLHITD